MQLEGIEYLSEMVYKVYIEGCEDSESEPDKWDDWGVMGREMWDTGVGTSEVPSGETDRAKGGAHEVTED